MQNSDMSLAPIPESKAKEPPAAKERHVSDKNLVDPIARSSEPGRHGEESVYVPPSQLHPERSTAQSAFDNPVTASSGGAYGLDHFLDKGSVAESTTEGAPQATPARGPSQSEALQDLGQKITTQVSQTTQQLDASVHRQPHLYALGAFGVGLLIGRFL